MIINGGAVQSATVRADRIARNGDSANKIGSYTLSVLARAHDVPLYVVAPSSTIDHAIGGGAEIPIEERTRDEVSRIGERMLSRLQEMCVLLEMHGKDFRQSVARAHFA